MVAEFPDAAPVPLRRSEGTRGVLHRLEDHHRDRLGPRGLDRLLELVEQERRELRLAFAGRPVIAVGVPDVVHLGDERFERLTDRRDAVDRECTHRRAVIRDVARNGLPPTSRALLKSLHRIEVDDGLDSLPRHTRGAKAHLASGGVVLARELPGRLHGLGPP